MSRVRVSSPDAYEGSPAIQMTAEDRNAPAMTGGRMMSSTDPMRPEGELRVTLPWPDRRLSPNARVHWAQKARVVKYVRSTASWIVQAGRGTSSKLRLLHTADIAIEFCPPDKRRRDLDNLIASMKAANDGIADALGIDDSKFQTTYRMGEPVKGGAVHVTIVRAA